MRYIQAAAFIVAFNILVVGGLLLIDRHIKKTQIPAVETSEDNFTEETHEAPEKAEIRCETASCETLGGSQAHLGSETTAEETTETTEEPTAEAQTEVPAGMDIECPVYKIEGVEFPYAGYLFNALADRGISWWMPYAVCQAYQESRFDPNAEAQNGKDKGLYQFRITFWTGGDIFDPYAQIEHYCNMVVQRLNEGRDTLTVISDHYTGAAGYSAEYVSDVMQWMSKLEVIE